MKQLTIESYGDGDIAISHHPFETHFNKQEVAEIRAYLNKDVIEKLEQMHNTACKHYHDTPMYQQQGSVHEAQRYAFEEALALLQGDWK